MASDLTGGAGASEEGTSAERQVRAALSWEAPRLPQLRTQIPRWASAASWSPPGTVALVRHRAIGGERRIVTTDRRPPNGYEIEYDLGALHQHAQPGTSRLLGSADGYAVTRVEGRPAEGMSALGWIEDAALPMTQALEVRRLDADGAEVLVAGPEDPLLGCSRAVRTLGFVEAFPIEPRRRPVRSVERTFGVLTRTTDAAGWRHRYSVLPPGVEVPEDEQIVSLGGVSLRPRPDYRELRLRADGTLASSLLATRVTPRRPIERAKWALAPLRWDARRIPHAWSAKAAGGRALRLLQGAGSGPAGEEQVLCHFRPEPLDGWVPLFAAHHPALPDQFITRSELEATDLGYVVDGILGYALLRLGQRDGLPAPPEIPWGSRFGQHRRVVEGPV